jgi:hypothetical protein
MNQLQQMLQDVSPFVAAYQMMKAVYAEEEARARESNAPIQPVCNGLMEYVANRAEQNYLTPSRVVILPSSFQGSDCDSIPRTLWQLSTIMENRTSSSHLHGMSNRTRFRTTCLKVNMHMIGLSDCACISSETHRDDG